MVKKTELDDLLNQLNWVCNEAEISEQYDIYNLQISEALQNIKQYFKSKTKTKIPVNEKIIRYFKNNGPATISEISESLLISKAQVSGALTELRKSGYNIETIDIHKRYIK